MPKSPARPPIRKSRHVKVSAMEKAKGTTRKSPMNMSRVSVGSSEPRLEA